MRRHTISHKECKPRATLIDMRHALHCPCLRLTATVLETDDTALALLFSLSNDQFISFS